MKKLKLVSCMLLMSFVLWFSVSVFETGGRAHAQTSSQQQAQIVQYWSPVLYQDVGSKPEGDIPVKVNFDGDWNAANSWENIGLYGPGSSRALTPNVYWSFVESETHYFIGYYLFYATHDPSGSLGDHENDMEGMMFAIRKSGVARKDGTLVTQTHGEMELALVPRHAKLGMFAPQNTDIRYTPGLSTVYYDGTFSHITDATGTHTRIYSAQNDASYLEANGDFGHALKAYNGGGAKGGTGFVMKSAAAAGQAVTNLNQPGMNYWQTLMSNFNENTAVYYELTPLESSLWALRNDMSLGLWASYGTFKGDNGRANAANAPWGWSFENYRELGNGTMLINPAYYIDQLFDDLGPFSYQYVTNIYQ